MKKVIDFIRTNKKIFIVVGAILVLVLIVCIMNTAKGEAGTSGGEVRSAEELQLIEILNRIEGVGKADVMITDSDDGIAGVIIVCEGGDNIMTRSDVLNAVSTALCIDKNNIAVYAMK